MLYLPPEEVSSSRPPFSPEASHFFDRALLGAIASQISDSQRLCQRPTGPSQSRDSLTAVLAAISLQLQAARQSTYAAVKEGEGSADGEEAVVARAALSAVCAAAVSIYGGMLHSQVARLLLHAPSTRQLYGVQRGMVADHSRRGEGFEEVTQPVDILRLVGPAEVGVTVAAAELGRPQRWKMDEAKLRPPSRPDTRGGRAVDVDTVVEGIPPIPFSGGENSCPQSVLALPLHLRHGRLVGVLTLANRRESRTVLSKEEAERWKRLNPIGTRHGKRVDPETGEPRYSLRTLNTTDH